MVFMRRFLLWTTFAVVALLVAKTTPLGRFLSSISIQAFPSASAEGDEDGAAEAPSRSSKKSSSSSPEVSEKSSEDANAAKAGFVFVSFEHLTPEKWVCLLEAAGVTVPLDGELRVSGGWSRSEDGKMTGFALVSSPSCPTGLYSLVRLNEQGRVVDSIDCRRTDVAELSFNLGMFWQTIEAPAEENEINLAVDGPGYFLKSCPDRGVMATREGRFWVDDEGKLLTYDNCQPLNERGEPIVNLASSQLDPRGCLSNGDCLALVDPFAYGYKNFAAIDSKNFAIDFDRGRLTESLVSETKLVPDMLEDLDNEERGLTGWRKADTWPVVPEKRSCEDSPSPAVIDPSDK